MVFHKGRCNGVIAHITNARLESLRKRGFDSSLDTNLVRSVIVSERRASWIWRERARGGSIVQFPHLASQETRGK